MELYVFWSAIGVIVYTYVGFPFLVLLRGLWLNRRLNRGEFTPAVSIVIAAHNEAANIGAKLKTMVALDYPADQLEIIVASDGSTDDTNQIVSQYSDRGVRLLALPRQGKAGVLNAACNEAVGEILVFTDANSMFAKDALRQLTTPFVDSTVGGVAGDQRYHQIAENASDAGEQSYWNFDRWMKRLQSRAGNVISATGAIYAIRKSLFDSVPEGVTDDFVTSTRVITKGYRLVFNEDAAAFEDAASSTGIEFSRKVRVMTRGLRGVWVMRELLNPLRFGFYSIQLFSHKVLRRLAVFPLIAILICSLLLWDQGLIYRIATLAQALVYGTAFIGWLLQKTPLAGFRPLALPFYLCLVNVAALVATWRLIRGDRMAIWTPQRGSPKREKLHA